MKKDQISVHHIKQWNILIVVGIFITLTDLLLAVKPQTKCEMVITVVTKLIRWASSRYYGFLPQEAWFI